MLAYLFLRIDYASGYDPTGSKFTRIDFFVTPAPSDGLVTTNAKPKKKISVLKGLVAKLTCFTGSKFIVTRAASHMLRSPIT